MSYMYMSYIYVLFFNHFNPSQYHTESITSHVVRKWYGRSGNSKNVEHEKAFSVTSLTYLIDGHVYFVPRRFVLPPSATSSINIYS